MRSTCTYKTGKNVFLYALFPYKLTEFRQNRPFFGPFSEHDASKRPLRGIFLISGAYKSGKTRRFIGPILKKQHLQALTPPVFQDEHDEHLPRFTRALSLSSRPQCRDLLSLPSPSPFICKTSYVNKIFRQVLAQKSVYTM